MNFMLRKPMLYPAELRGQFLCMYSLNASGLRGSLWLPPLSRHMQGLYALSKNDLQQPS